MSEKLDNVTIHTALLLLEEIIEQTQTEAGVGDLRQMVARSAMGLSHEDRHTASEKAHELLEHYSDSIAEQVGRDE